MTKNGTFCWYQGTGKVRDRQGLVKRSIRVCKCGLRQNLWADKEEGRKYNWITYFRKRIHNYFQSIYCTVSNAETYTEFPSWSRISQKPHKPSHTICNTQSALFIAGLLALERTTSVFFRRCCSTQSCSTSVNNMKGRHFAVKSNRLMLSAHSHPTSFRPNKIILPSTLVSTKWSLSLKFTEQNVTIYHHTLACYMHHLFPVKTRVMACTSHWRILSSECEVV